MDGRAIFYRLTHKFVHDESGVPENARQVVYYSLAIGHHVGVMDCFRPWMDVSLDDLSRWLGALPEGPARRKLEGVLRWGEIEINRSHADDLMPALTAALPRLDPAGVAWAGRLLDCLREMTAEPAFYLMVRRSA